MATQATTKTTQSVSMLLAHRTTAASAIALQRRLYSSSPGSSCRVQTADIAQGGSVVRVGFSDGSAFDFHGMWLRDACQDPELFSARAGERFLARTPFATNSQGKAKDANIVEGSLALVFDDEVLSGRPVHFSSDFLRMYGPVVGKLVCAANDRFGYPLSDAFDWLEPYSGFDRAPAPNLSLKALWKNDGPASNVDVDQFQHRDYSVVSSSDAGNLEMLQTLMEHGVVILDNVPAAVDSNIVRGFADNCLGGMQKDPVREEPNWVIKRKDDAASSAYTYHLRLNNHTDQAVAPHGLPGLIVTMHYLSGTGVNTLVDAYAVIEALRERDPEALRLLSTYGNCQQRDFIGSRVDFKDSFRRVSADMSDRSLMIQSKSPIIQVDHAGRAIRVQYNEIARTPSTITFDQFPKWYRALTVWNDMIHSSEFEVELPLRAGQILVFDNWRVLHGRAANACSPDRLLMGGTVLREAFYSRAIQLMGSCYPVADYRDE